MIFTALPIPITFVFCRKNKKNASATSSSDSESDEDYVPSSKELKDEGNASVDENSDATGSEEENDESNRGKRKRTDGRKKKKTKIEEIDEEANTEPKPEQNIDDIWNEFKKDVESKQPKIAKVKESESPTISEPQEAKEENPKTKTITELFEFAGEAVPVEKEVPVDEPPPKCIPTTSAPRRSAGGLSSVLGQIGKKNKLSILEKSKLDWNSFKKEEGIEADLQTHNKGKDGFLEKQDFLQRTDLRQFEIEKAMRSTSRRLK